MVWIAVVVFILFERSAQTVTAGFKFAVGFTKSPARTAPATAMGVPKYETAATINAVPKNSTRRG